MQDKTLQLGWTATVHGKDISASITLTDWDGTTDSPAYMKTVSLLNDQMKRSIQKALKQEAA